MTPSEVFKAASPSVVTIHSMDAASEIMQGSGIVIRPGVVVSNCHVIKAATAITTGWLGQQYPTRLLHADPDRDLCSLEVDGLPAPAVTMGSASGLDIGDPVFAIGAPRGLSLTLSAGLLSSRRGELLQISAPISPGSSGGGLFDGLGRLIGVTTMYLQESQQLNFAVPVEWIAEIPARAAQLTRTPTANPAVEAARRQLQEWDAFMADSDPEYMGLRSELDDRVRVLRDELPPDQWLEATKEAYAELRSQPGAEAQRWIPLPHAPSIAPTFLDLKTIRKEGSIAQAWLKVQTAESDDMSRFTFDCQRDLAAMSPLVSHADDGTASLAGRETGWFPVPPGSVLEVALGIACRQ